MPPAMKNSVKVGEKTDVKVDPLYTIFEKNLYEFKEQDGKSSLEIQQLLISKIVGDYLKFLKQHMVAVPKRWEKHVIEELQDQVRKMLVKKTYGCLSVEDFIQKQNQKNQKQFKESKKKARKKFLKLF